MAYWLSASKTTNWYNHSIARKNCFLKLTICDFPMSENGKLLKLAKITIFMASNEIISLKKVTKYYEMGEEIVKALDGIDIKIEKGDFVAIMGPSGSGKSTGMNLIGSLDRSTKGRVYLSGQDIDDFEESDLAQIRGKKIGFIFQQFNLIPNLTAKENV